ncbi:MAG: hypothetical protein J6S27_04805 [Thermoguttaceae bacterium]|nr:hypothetical protein [Thermoguttaceae bacterium]
MCVQNKVLLSLIALAAIFFFVLGANRFKLGKEWEEKIAKQSQQIEDLQNQIDKLHADIYSDSSSVANDLDWSQRPLKLRLDTLRAHHGGALWAHCVPRAMPQWNDGRVRTIFGLGPDDRPKMFGETLLEQDAKYYVFDSGAAAPAEGADTAEGASGEAVFLGTFICDTNSGTPYNAEAKEMSIVSVGTLTDAEVDKITESVQAGHEWFVYVGDLPSDNPALLAGLLSDPATADYIAAFPEELRAYLAKGGVDSGKLLPASADEEADTPKVKEVVVVDNLMVGSVDDEEENTDTEKTEVTVVVDPEPVLAEPAEGLRLPRDYAQMLLVRSGKRDSLNLTIQRYNTALEDLCKVICDQYASIGLDALPDDFMAQISSDSEQVDMFKAQFAEAVQKNPATPEMKIKADTLMRLTAAEKERDLVKAKADEATRIVEQLQQRIDTLLTENDSLAAKISRALFTSVDNITQQAARLTETRPSLVPSSDEI